MFPVFFFTIKKEEKTKTQQKRKKKTEHEKIKQNQKTIKKNSFLNKKTQKKSLQGTRTPHYLFVNAEASNFVGTKIHWSFWSVDLVPSLLSAGEERRREGSQFYTNMLM